MRPPGSRSFYVGVTFLLTAVIVAILVAFNRRYFFEARAYEFADMAANSLDILRAKQWQLYYGNYSRWGFHHPGPALFYLLAWGESLLYDGLHLTPTPLNAQVLVVLGLTASFLAAGLGVAARWVRSPVFVPLALLLAALHFSSLYLEFCMYETWTAYTMPIPFFCLIVTAASVAAGQGEDLPLLALTGCFIIHVHVAHPLFVLPLFTIAYLGLWWACRRTSEPEPAGTPWRAYPRAHRWTAAIVGLFVLPILIDLCHGANSNVALILHHLRTHRGEHHPYVDAVTYFVKFGAYKPPGTVQDSSWPETARYVGHHPEMYGLWLLAAVLPLVALGWRRGLRRPTIEADLAEAGDERVRGRWRFLGWFACCLAATVALTIFWAHIQDGLMFNYNAWFNYGIYYALAVLGAVALTDLAEVLFARVSRPRLLTGAAALLCLALVGVVGVARPARFRATLGVSPALYAMADTVFTTLAEHPDAPRTKFLDVPDSSALGAGPAVAILLRRAGYGFRVRPEWKTMFGYANALGDDYPASLLAAEKETPLETWRFVPAAAAPETFARHPLIDNFGLAVGVAAVDPTAGFVIRLAGSGYNAGPYGSTGFSPPGPGFETALTLDAMAVLQFVPVPVPADSSVEIRLDFTGALINARHPVQRLTVRFDGAEVGRFAARVNEPFPDLRVTVPAATWNAAQPFALLTLEFPDAAAPRDVDDRNKDPRVIGFFARGIGFRVVGPPSP